MVDVYTGLSNYRTNDEAILCSRHLFDEHESSSLNGEEQFSKSSGSTTDVLTSPETTTNHTCSPSEIVLDSKTNEGISLFTAMKLSTSVNFSSMKTNTPLKITQFREDILNLQSQLDTANIEKNAITIALNHACSDFKNMTEVAKVNDLDYDNTSKSTQKDMKILAEEYVSSRKITSKVRSNERKLRQLCEWQEMSRQERQDSICSNVCSNNEVVYLREELHERNEEIHI